MVLDRVIEQTFPIKCKGRDANGNNVLKRPIRANVIISQSVGSETISSFVKCRYNTGGHGQRCNAFGSDNAGCPYAFDIPYALEKKK